MNPPALSSVEIAEIPDMAFTELELARHKRDLESFMKRRRPPVHIRDKLDHGYRFVGQSVELYDIHPDFRDPSVKRETPFAKATYVERRIIGGSFG